MKTGLLQPIIKKVLVILPFYLFTFLPLTAQTFTQRIQKSTTGEGTVTIHHDAAIDELVNGPVPTAKPKQATRKATPAKPKQATRKATPAKPKQATRKATPAKPKQATRKATPAKPKQATRKATPAKPVTKDNKKENQKEEEKDTPAIQTKDTIEDQQEGDSLATPKRTYKAIGYRVQVLAGGNTRKDRQRAEQTGRSLRSLFPGEEVYVHFYSPRWICRLGNYRTYEEAHEKMLEVRKMGYEAATIVKGKITLTEEIK